MEIHWKEGPFFGKILYLILLEIQKKTILNYHNIVMSLPYILKLLKTPRRFVTFIRGDGKTELRFGSGISDNPDEEIIPNPNNVGSSLLVVRHT